MIPPLVIAGATASGKSALALRLAREQDAEIVNLDPFQALDGLPILTAQPSAQDRKAVPHHLYGGLPLDSELTAPEFAVRVDETVEAIHQRGKRAVLVTGSGLYLRAFSHGVDAQLPKTPTLLQTELAARPLAENLEELERLDPVEFARVDRANPHRVQRAVALCRLLGGPVSAHRQAGPDWLAAPQRALEGIWVERPREDLWKRIEARTAAMFADGVEAEVADLEGRALGPAVARVIGLREVRAVLHGELTRSEAIEKIAILTRQYAKRQRTWFAKEGWLQRWTPGAGECR